MMEVPFIEVGKTGGAGLGGEVRADLHIGCEMPVVVQLEKTGWQWGRSTNCHELQLSPS